MNKQPTKIGWALGFLIMIGLQLLGYIFGGWKWAAFWFVIPQMVLLFAKLAVEQKEKNDTK